MSSKRKGDDEELGLGANPLEERDPLVSTFYRAPEAPKGRARRGKGRQPLKEGRTWRLVTFSFYEEDVRRLDALLSDAKRRGHRRVSRSQIVRLALRQVDLASLPELI
ncbi:MAG: hypothetical protein HYS27_15480 [Deltaproteobacteria bacterium]|nr:hypothetical protein [Deltaproteobacteria bacterium]